MSLASPRFAVCPPTGSRHLFGALLLGSAVFASAVSAAEPEEFQEDFETASEVSEQKDSAGWVLVPIPFSNPTLGSGLQIPVLYLHEYKEGSDRNATSGLGALVSDNGSWFAGLMHDNNFFKDALRVTALAGYGELVLTYYLPDLGNGVGPFNLTYELDSSVLFLKALGQLPGTEHWYLGGHFLFMDLTIGLPLDSIPPEYHPALEEFFTAQQTNAAAGIDLTYDSRNDNYFPTEGILLESKYEDYGADWGGDNEYSKLTSSLAFYWPTLNNRFITALRVRHQYAEPDADSEIPFYDKPYLSIRGYDRGRYMGDATLSTHAEVRYRFSERWAAIGFYESGWAFEDLLGYTNKSYAHSFGGGLRWKVLAEKELNLGFDVAYADDDFVYYVKLGEQF